MTFDLDVVPPSVLSIAPNLVMLPSSTALCGICPEASQVLVKCDKDNPKEAVSDNSDVQLPCRFNLLKFCGLSNGPLDIKYSPAKSVSYTHLTLPTIYSV